MADPKSNSREKKPLKLTGTFDNRRTCRREFYYDGKEFESISMELICAKQELWDWKPPLWGTYPDKPDEN